MRIQPLTPPEVLRGSAPPAAELLAVLADGVVLLGPGERVLFVNAAAERVLGCTAAALLGQPFFDSLPYLANAELGRLCRQVLGTAEPAAVELYANPARAWFEVRGFLGGFGLALLFRDVTAARQQRAALRAAEERARRLHDLTLEVARARSPEEMAARILEEAALYLEAPTGVLGCVDDDDASLVLLAQRGRVSTPPAHTRQGLHELPIAAEVVRQGRALWLSPRTAIEAHFPGAGELLDEPSAQACALLPLSSEGRVLAVLALFWPEPRLHGEEERAFAETFARLCAQPLARALLDVQLRSSEAHRQALLDHSPSAIYVKDSGGRYLYANRFFVRRLGLCAEELLGKTDFELPFAGSAARLRAESDRRVLVTGGALTSEETLDTAEGRATFISTRFLLPGTFGATAALGGISHDISDRKRAEEHLRFLADASAALSASLDEERILQRLCELAVLHFVDGAAVDVLQADGTLGRVALAHQSLEGEGIPEVVRTGRASLLGGPFDSPVDAAAGPPRGGKGHLSFPLVARGQVYGAVTFLRTSRPRPFTDGELELAQELARRASVAVDNARLYREAQEARSRAEALQALASAMSHAHREEEVARATLQQGLAAVGAHRGAVFRLRSELCVAVAEHGFPPEFGARLGQLRTSELPRASEVLRTGSAAWTLAPEEDRSAFGEGARVLLPLWGHGVVSGLLLLEWRVPGPVTAQTRAFVEALAQQCAQALERVELQWAERTARERAEAAAATLDAAMEQLPAGLAVVEAPSGEVLVANSRLHEVLGHRFEGLGGAEGGHSPLVQLLRTGERVRGEELTYLRADGERVRLRVHAGPVQAPDGRTMAGVAVVEDVTAQRRAEEHLRFLSDLSAALARSLRQSEMALELARVAVPQFSDWCAVFLRGEDGRVQLSATQHREDAECPRLLALHREALEATGPSAEGFGPPEALHSGQPALLELPPGARAHGTRQVLCVPLTAKGQVLGAVSFGCVQGQRRLTEQDLLVAVEVAHRAGVALENGRLYALAEAERRRAQEASRLKDEFLSTVSHELRTPLTSILGWVQMLRAGSLAPEKHSKALKVIERSARAQAQLVEDLLDVSRIITGKLRLDIQTVELAAVIDAALEAARPAAEAKGVRLEHALEPAVVMGDGSRLQQVVWNLLSNAVKFTPPGGTVGVRLCEEEAGVRIEVWDSGQGIPPHFLPHVFERFRQAEGSATREHGGLGLGLSIVKHLVELHGGTVSAQSDGKGQGARFGVQLPTSIRAPQRPQGRTLSGDAFPVVRAPLVTGLRVLLVEDEPDARELLTTLVEGCEAKVVTASSAEEALTLLREWRPDVLISDVGLPGESGYALLERLRQLPAEQGGRTPAVAVTAYARSEDRTRALLAGFDLHLPKPVEPKELYAVLSALSARRH